MLSKPRVAHKRPLHLTCAAGGVGIREVLQEVDVPGRHAGRATDVGQRDAQHDLRRALPAHVRHAARLRAPARRRGQACLPCR